MTRRLLERFAEQRPPSDRHGALRVADLTERERETLWTVRGRSNTETWRSCSSPSADRRAPTRTRIFAKLGLRDRVQAVILAYDAGLVQPGPNDAG